MLNYIILILRATILGVQNKIKPFIVSKSIIDKSNAENFSHFR